MVGRTAPTPVAGMKRRPAVGESGGMDALKRYVDSVEDINEQFHKRLKKIYKQMVPLNIDLRYRRG